MSILLPAKSRWIVALGFGLPAIVIICYAVLADIPDLGRAVPEMLAVGAVITICLAGITYLAERGGRSFSPIAILALAACFRLLFICHPAQLSDDVHRYLLDGSLLLNGQNPYRWSPAAVAEQTPAMATLAARVNHPNLVTIYPPAAQVLFAGGAMLGGIHGVKLVLTLLDLLCIGLMMRLLFVLNFPPQRIVLYAWHPLPVLEISASGHVDGAVLLLVFAAFLVLVPGRRGLKNDRPSSEQSPPESRRHYHLPAFWSGFFLGLAVLIKLYPVVLAPLWIYLVRNTRIKTFVLGFFAALAFLILPFCPDISNSLATLKHYTVSWEFSGLLFRVFRSLLSSGVAARILLGVGFGLFLLFCYRSPRKYLPKIYSMNAGLPEILKACTLIAFCFLLCTPTLHPWYALYLLGFLPFYPTVPGLILTWSVTLGYRVLIYYSLSGRWVEVDSVPVLIWLGPAAAALLVWRMTGAAATAEARMPYSR